MRDNNGHDDYATALLVWMRHETIVMRETPVRDDWHNDIVNRAVANMPVVRAAWDQEFHRRKIAANLAWSLIVFVIVSLVVAFVTAWNDPWISIIALLSSWASIAGLVKLYRIERAHYGRQNVG